MAITITRGTNHLAAASGFVNLANHKHVEKTRDNMELWEEFQEFKTRLTNLCTDYKKGNDSVPHTWTLECLKLYKTKRTLRASIRNPMGMWSTTPEDNFKPKVGMKCGFTKEMLSLCA